MSIHNVLLIGSGGREHALAWKLSQSEELRHLYVAPGNPGTGTIATNVELDITDFEGIARFAHEREVDLVVVGPEQPLVDGRGGCLEEEKRAVCGPGKGAARLGGSKEGAKGLRKRYESA